MKGFVAVLIAVAALVFASGQAHADSIDDRVGSDGATGDSSGSLSNGWTTGNLSWTHTYGAINGTITRAILWVDVLDADSGSLKVYVGSSSSGFYLGENNPDDAAANLGSPPTEEDWLGIGAFGDPIQEFTLPSSLYSDLADGSFQLYAANNAMSTYGVNRSRLYIEYAPNPVPEPGTLVLLGAGLLGAGTWRRRRARR